MLLNSYTVEKRFSLAISDSDKPHHGYISTIHIGGKGGNLGSALK